jgi:hypothetical protein
VATCAVCGYEAADSFKFCAQALVELGRPGEAKGCIRRGEELAPSHEVDPQVHSRFVRARLLAGRELEQAVALYERKGNLVMAERVRSML